MTEYTDKTGATVQVERSTTDEMFEIREPGGEVAGHADFRERDGERISTTPRSGRSSVAVGSAPRSCAVPSRPPAPRARRSCRCARWSRGSWRRTTTSSAARTGCPLPTISPGCVAETPDVAVPALDRTQREVYRQLVRTAVASREASTAAGLDEALLEMVNVRVSQINGCVACLGTHVPAARKAGVTQQRLDLLAAWRDLDGFTAAEKAALRLAETLTRLDDVDERTAATEAVAEHFSDEQLSALEWTIVL